MNYKYVGVNNSFDQQYIFSYDDCDDDNIEPDFSTFNLQEYLYNILTVEKDEDHSIIFFLKAISKLSLSQENIFLILEGCQIRLVESENELNNSKKKNGGNDNLSQEIIYRIVLILDCLAKDSMEIKNAIVDNISLEKILEFTLKFPHIFIRNVSFLFLSLLQIQDEQEEESNTLYLTKFENFFPLFEKLYIELKSLYLIKILKIFILLTQVPSFLTYFNKENQIDETKSIINDIMSMAEAKNNKLLFHVLTFSYLVIKKDIEKSIDYIDLYINLLGKGSSNGNYIDNDDDALEVVCLTSKIIRYIIKHELEYIPLNSHLKIGIQTMENAKNSKSKNKIIFLKCLFSLTEKCNSDCLDKLLQNSFGAFLADFLDFYDDAIIFLVLDQINTLADKEMATKKTQNVLVDFMNNGGNDFFEDYSINGENQDIADEITKISQKIDSNEDVRVQLNI